MPGGQRSICWATRVWALCVAGCERRGFNGIALSRIKASPIRIKQTPDRIKWNAACQWYHDGDTGSGDIADSEVKAITDTLLIYLTVRWHLIDSQSVCGCQGAIAGLQVVIEKTNHALEEQRIGHPVETGGFAWKILYVGGEIQFKR